MTPHGGVRDELTASFAPQMSILQCPVLELESLIVNYANK